MSSEMIESTDTKHVSKILARGGQQGTLLYERYDFDRVGDPILMPKGGPSAQPMLRQPKRQ